MKEVIKLLPDHIANQIAAGEVVQRPASVVKELLENAIDAGATRVDLLVKDAGKALIQVIDNGCGMSANDARLAFARHATSKITAAEDLFNIRTMGFRGEAMASIAAVAQVTLKTRLHQAELGTEICIEGSDLKKNEPVLCPRGTSVAVKNLFFNVPARRNFLKTNPVETRHIINEFMRVGLAQPELNLRFEHNGNVVYDLEATDLEQRIVQLFGKTLDGALIPVGEDTPYVCISGFVGSPDAARKKRGDQYFFVNRRFIKSGYLHHSMARAFEGLLPEETHPFYCVFFEIDPAHIDINIHPTKTEIKFDDERTVYQLLHSVIRKGLGEYHAAPIVEAEEDQGLVQLIRQTPQLRPPQEETIGTPGPVAGWSAQASKSSWEQLYPKNSPRDQHQRQHTPKFLFPEEETPPSLGELKVTEPMTGRLAQLGARYIVSQSRDGLVVIDQCHAHQRILFEKFRKAGTRTPLASQQLLFPRTLDFSPVDFTFMREIEAQVRRLGFDLQEFGPNTYILQGVPTVVKGSKAEKFFEEIIAEVRETGGANAESKLYDRLARAIARKSAMQPGKQLSPGEMRIMVDELFQCEQPATSPWGKPTMYRLNLGDLEQHFG
ncbi:MAG: DNA mismatch repair endonuclease MutL [Bacteroidota bacterium]